MAPAATKVRKPPRKTAEQREPTWEIARIFPFQGEWTEQDYLGLDRNGENLLIELADGRLEFLPMPDLIHQGNTKYLFRAFDDHATANKSGEVFAAPSPVRLWAGQMREPDLFFLKPQRIKDRRRPPDGADLAVEIVSPGKKNRSRDLTTNRRLYARAEIPEYWMVDPKRRTITVLSLSGTSYTTHGVFKPGERATSKLLSGFSVDVTAVFAAGRNR